jgi:hypothetical protein
MRKFLVVLFLFPLVSYSQFKIICDQTYEPKIRTAIKVIKETDSGAFCLFTDYCQQIRISDDTIPKFFSDGLINVPLRLISQRSFNNISSWFVRQSYGLRLTDVNPNMDPEIRQEMILMYELEFNKKLPREYGNSFKERLRKFFDSLSDEPYEWTD